MCAVDGGDSARFSSIFLASSFFCSQTESTPAPPPLTQTGSWHKINIQRRNKEMVEEIKISFPIIPVRQWWILQNKFRQSIPSSVTPGYLAAALTMKAASAKANILPSLVRFRIIDQDGKPTDRAIQWRDEGQYSTVCEEIRTELYPQELLDALPPPSPNRESVERWFANKTGAGKKAAERMALVYLLLCEANPAGGQGVSTTTPKKEQRPKQKRTVDAEIKPVAPARSQEPLPEKTTSRHQTAISSIPPSLHIDIQIHISSDTSSEQIDQIFASMAKHLSKLLAHGDE
jgi:hypothetical protein